MPSFGRKMTNGRTPRAFLSHSSADKERFVLGFADRPGLGRPPAYVASLIEAVPYLDNKDSSVLKIMGT
jgi:hypothetical protein